MYQCTGEDGGDGKDHFPTSQLGEIVLLQLSNLRLGLADCYSQGSSRVYSEAAVNKHFSTKTHTSKQPTNAVSLPAIIHCQMASELRKATYIQKQCCFAHPFQIHFVKWNQFHLPQGKSEPTQAQTPLFTLRTMAILTTGRKYLQPLSSAF